MPAGTFTIFRRAKPKLITGVIDLDTQTLKLALTTNVQSITDDFAGSSTDCRYADLTAEVASGSGYTTGGATLTSVTVTRSGATVTLDAADVSWPSSTFTAKYGILYADNTNDDLIGFVDLETGSSTGVSPSAATLSVNWNASGIFTLT